MRFAYYFLGCLLFSGIFACSGKHKNSGASPGSKDAPVIQLLDTLSMYNPDTDKFYAAKDSISPSRNRVVVSIDASTCFTCAEDFIIWDKIMQSAGNKNVSYLFYLHIHDFDEIRPLFKKWRFYHPVVVDSNNTFFSANKLSGDKRFRAMILDDKNHLTFLGNPIYSEDDRKFYSNFLKEQIEL